MIRDDQLVAGTALDERPADRLWSKVIRAPKPNETTIAHALRSGF
ncbi:MAG: hypothetical protein NZM07_05185 [Elioraea sp.]|nr:hypothetical protein [Elioraea sp.]MDW8399108.1 hypothetical protein [Acetobacteraceae bacterium]